jgi:hypothetical protein
LLTNIIASNETGSKDFLNMPEKEGRGKVEKCLKFT